MKVLERRVCSWPREASGEPHRRGSACHFAVHITCIMRVLCLLGHMVSWEPLVCRCSAPFVTSPNIFLHLSLVRCSQGHLSVTGIAHYSFSNLSLLSPWKVRFQIIGLSRKQEQISSKSKQSLGAILLFYEFEVPLSSVWCMQQDVFNTLTWLFWTCAHLLFESNRLQVFSGEECCPYSMRANKADINCHPPTKYLILSSEFQGKINE